MTYRRSSETVKYSDLTEKLIAAKDRNLGIDNNNNSKIPVALQSLTATSTN